MNKARLCICMLMSAGLLVLGGCVHTTRSSFPRHYTLDTPAPVVHPRAADRGQYTLQITRIDVPPWLQGSAMYYRLDYQRDNRIATYARSDWMAPPAALLENIVQNAISTGGGWRAVLGPGTPGRADATLHIRLDDFSQAFADPQRSAAVIDATVTLIDNHDSSVVAQKHFHVQIAAPSADAPGGAKAMSRASGQFAAQVQQWLQATANAAPTHFHESK